MEDSKDEDIGIDDLVANLIVPDQYPSDFAGLEFCHPSAETRVSWNSFRAGDQVAHDTSRGRSVDGFQEFIEANEVGAGAVCPLEGHD